MGSFDVYCALCSGPLNSEVAKSGSTDADQMAHRCRYMERLKKARAAGKDDSRCDVSDDEYENEEVRDAEDFATFWKRRQRSWKGSDDGDCYDPEVISESDGYWLDYTRCLGLNLKTDKGYVSGDISQDDCGTFNIQQRSDPNQPEDVARASSYRLFGDPEHVFPYHERCMDILVRIITGFSDDEAYEEIDKRTLFYAMTALMSDGAPTLDIAANRLNGACQFWEVVLGEEYSVAEPILSNADVPAIASKLSTGFLSLQRDDSVIGKYSPPSTSDPFGTLSPEIMQLIASYLPGKAILALSRASWPFLVTTSFNNILWKVVLDRDMPWAAGLFKNVIEGPWRLDDEQSEADEDANDNDGGDETREDCQVSHPGQTSTLAAAKSSMDYKALYLWVDHITEPVVGMGRPYVGLANRRRIWRGCDVVAKKYFRLLEEDKGERETSGNGE